MALRHSKVFIEVTSSALIDAADLQRKRNQLASIQRTIEQHERGAGLAVFYNGVEVHSLDHKHRPICHLVWYNQQHVFDFHPEVVARLIKARRRPGKDKKP
eukprot:4895529-Amphidinium_carterae.1